MAEEKNGKPEKTTGNIQWDNKPKSIIGWFLWIFPERHWKKIIGVVAIYVAVVAVWGTYLLFTQRQQDIEAKSKDRVLKEKLKYWNGSDDPALRSGLLKLWNERGDVPEEIWDDFNSIKETEVLIAMASHPWVPEDIEIRLLNNENVRIRIASILNNKRNRIEVFKLLATDKDKYVCISVARNSNTPVELLEKLAKDEDSDVKEAVAMNSNTPVEILKQLAKDKDWRVRIAIVGNINTPVEQLKQLAKDDYVNVCEAVAGNSNAPVEILKQLAKDKNEYVREAVAGNSNTAVEILKQLGVDPMVNVMSKAIYTLLSKSESEWEKELGK